MKQSKFGFTLIETIVVVAVIGLTLPVIFAIIFTLMRQQIKIYRLTQVKREGDYIINSLENTIRNRAVTIHSDQPSDANIVCSDTNYPASGTVDNLYFLDEDKQWFGYLFENNSIASKSADLDNPPNILTFALTSSKILVDSSFSISCSRNTVYSAPSVMLGFDVCYDTGAGVCTGTRPEEITSMHYQTRIKLRSY
jgi:prepilin-type N-terminal cleavage/methylation domain-containing protein